MLTQPDLKEEDIIACLEKAYGVVVKSLVFLPVGADFNTAVYRVGDANSTDYFLKLRQGDFLEASVVLPDFLARGGVKEVIPPLRAKTGDLWITIGSFKAALYPFIEGVNAAEFPLSKDQWHLFGATIKALHTACLPQEVTIKIPQETFGTDGADRVLNTMARLQEQVFQEDLSLKSVSFLEEKRSEIMALIIRTKALAQKMKNQPGAYVLCHADIHGWNLLVSQEGGLYVVDWDTLIFAPKERDLMFIGAGISPTMCSPDEEHSLFYAGYGRADIDRQVLAYYRYARVLEDVAEYAEHLLDESGNRQARSQSLVYLMAHFKEGSLLARAYEADR